MRFVLYHVLIRQDFAADLFLKSEFVLLNYSAPKRLLCFDYLALMGLCIFIAHYGSGLRRRKKEVRPLQYEN